MSINYSSHRSVRYELNVIRMLVHMVMGLLYVILYEFWLSKQMMLFFIGTCLIACVVMEVLRHYSSIFNNLFLRFLRPFLREFEIQGIHSGIPYVLACFLVILIFPQQVAILSILFLAFGDPAASLAGILWGSLFWPKFSNGKSVSGTFGSVLTCITIAYIITKEYKQSILFGFIGGVAEMLPLPVNDNFSAPMISAFMMYMLNKIGST